MRRTPQQSRFLGLWTATWLFVLLLALLLWVGDPGLQWPVLLVPVVWALLSLRRGRRGRRRRPPAVRRPDDEPWSREESWLPVDDVPPPERRPSPTRELPLLPEVPRDRREE